MTPAWQTCVAGHDRFCRPTAGHVRGCNFSPRTQFFAGWLSIASPIAACFVAHGCRDTCGEGLVNEKKLFEIGSIAKLFTALLLSDMANRGEEPYSVGNLIIVDGFAA